MTKKASILVKQRPVLLIIYISKLVTRFLAGSESSSLEKK